MKRNNVIVALILMLILFFIINSAPAQNLFFSFREFVQPQLREKIAIEWSSKSSDFLLKQLQGTNYAYVGIAADILQKRNEARAVPILIKLTHSQSEGIKNIAFIALGTFRDERSIEPLLEIVRIGPKHKDYINALRALSLMKYDPIYHNVVELAKTNTTDRAYAISMLEYFGKPDALPILANMVNNDSEWYIRENAKKAIEKIKAGPSQKGTP